jgi:exonuclease III
MRQLSELIIKEKVDVVGVQETIKQSFSLRELQRLNQGGEYSWEWVPAIGHSGGILMGVKKDRFEVEEWETGDFFVGAIIRDRLKNIRCEVITVYGPVDHQRSNAFLEELDTKCKGLMLPAILGGILT